MATTGEESAARSVHRRLTKEFRRFSKELWPDHGNNKRGIVFSQNAELKPLVYALKSLERSFYEQQASAEAKHALARKLHEVLRALETTIDGWRRDPVRIDECRAVIKENTGLHTEMYGLVWTALNMRDEGDAMRLQATVNDLTLSHPCAHTSSGQPVQQVDVDQGLVGEVLGLYAQAARIRPHATAIMQRIKAECDEAGKGVHLDPVPSRPCRLVELTVAQCSSRLIQKVAPASCCRRASLPCTAAIVSRCSLAPDPLSPQVKEEQVLKSTCRVLEKRLLDQKCAEPSCVCTVCDVVRDMFVCESLSALTFALEALVKQPVMIARVKNRWSVATDPISHIPDQQMPGPRSKMPRSLLPLSYTSPTPLYNASDASRSRMPGCQTLEKTKIKGLEVLGPRSLTPDSILLVDRVPGSSMRQPQLAGATS